MCFLKFKSLLICKQLTCNPYYQQSYTVRFLQVMQVPFLFFSK